ncbi:hypothetical protein, partial [Dapis sp. BLCC M172]|uniref:hypothetical protein n=1 Tax=Dapis sp. BLCC M172 TaxID=2975281 RepID=UPI003CEA1C9A
PKTSDETVETSELIPEQPTDLVQEKSTVKSPEITPEVSYETIEPQQLISEQPTDLVQEKSTVKSPEITPEVSYETIEPQQLISEQPTDLVQEKSTVKSPEIEKIASDETVESKQLIQEKHINLVPKNSTIPASEKKLEETNIASDKTLEVQQLIPELPIDLVQENSTIQSPEITPPASDETIQDQKFIPELPIDSLQEKFIVKSQEISPKALDETIETQQLTQDKPIDLFQQKSTVELPEKSKTTTEDLALLKSEITDTIPQETTENQVSQIQPRLNPENLTNLNPIQSHSPLAQQSDFIQSQLMNEFFESLSTSETLTDIGSFKPSKNQATPQITEVWSNQFQLIDESVPVIDNIQESWSNITEILDYDRFNPSSNSQLPLETSELITIGKEQSIPELPTSISSSSAKVEKVIGEDGEITLIDKEQLEMLARKVYNLLRQQLEIERERHDFKTGGSLPWLDTISQTAPIKTPGLSSSLNRPGQLQSQTGATVSLVNYKLQTLTRKIYQLLQLKIEIERERLGLYYRGNIPW